MKRSATALGFLMCMLAASVFAMGSARGAGKFTSAVTKISAVKNAPEIMPVAYVVVLREASEKSTNCVYECGEQLPRRTLNVTSDLPALTRIGDGRDFPVFNYLLGDNSQLTTLDCEWQYGFDNEGGTPEKLFPPAPPVIFDLDGTHEPTSTKPIKSANGIITDILTGGYNGLTLWLRQQAVYAQRSLAASGGAGCYTVAMKSIEQVQLDREIRELFGDDVKPAVNPSPAKTADDSPAYPVLNLKLDRQAIQGAARALDQLGQSLQGISQRLEKLAKTQPERWAYPEISPRSSRATVGETSR